MQNKNSGWWLAEFQIANFENHEEIPGGILKGWKVVRQVYNMLTFDRFNERYSYLGFTYDPQEAINFIKTGERPITQETRSPNAPEKSYSEPDWKEDPAVQLARMATLRPPEKRNKPNTLGNILDLQGDGSS